MMTRASRAVELQKGSLTEDHRGEEVLQDRRSWVTRSDRATMGAGSRGSPSTSAVDAEAQGRVIGHGTPFAELITNGSDEQLVPLIADQRCPRRAQ